MTASHLDPVFGPWDGDFDIDSSINFMNDVNFVQRLKNVNWGKRDGYVNLPSPALYGLLL